MTIETIATVVAVPATVVVATPVAAAEKPAKAPKVAKPKFSKIVNGELSLENCALDQLKRAKEGDELLLIHGDGRLVLAMVCIRHGRQGRNGGTVVWLKNLLTEEPIELPNTQALPDGVIDIRRVGKHVNARTERKLAEEQAAREAAEAAAVAATESPAPMLALAAESESSSAVEVASVDEADVELVVVDDAAESGDAAVAAMLSDLSV